MRAIRFRLARTGAMLLAAVLVAAASTAALDAQRPAGGRGDRAQLETRLREAWQATLRRELRLNDAQERQLHETMRTFEGQRRALLRDERRTRIALREELQRPEGPRDAQVGGLIDTLLALQERRVRLARAEQDDLARFLAPVQRARYLALHENLRRRMAGRAAEGRRPGGPPPP
jgi:Spy/CpxP family protein refolding chaperone